MIELLIIISCLIINAILAGSETAFIAVSRSSVRELAKQGNKKAIQLLEMRENPERTLSIVQVGITFVGALAAAVSGAGAEEILTPWFMKNFGMKEIFAEFISLILVVVPLTFFSVVLGELVPKTFALKRSLFLATETAPWLQMLSRLLSPIVSVLEWSTKALMRMFTSQQTLQENTIEESSIDLGILNTSNQQYVLNIVKIEKTTVAEILLNWSEVVYVSESYTMNQVEQTIISSAHTRLPVLKDDQVVGVVNAKEFLAFQKSSQTNWQSLIRPAIKIQDQMPILSALQLMQANRTQMAIVFLSNIKVGMITMEMIFEEIIGDIYDENDESSILKKFNKQFYTTF